ncbi:MAG: DUF444 family protein [Patescibacteria group bacterium]
MGTIRNYSPSDADRSDRAAGDRLRHRQKVRASIRDNIADIISEESIIGRDRGTIVKVPIRGIKEYRFVYGKNQKGTVTGDGNTQQGQIVGKTQDGQGLPDKAGDKPGVDYYETEITLDELIDIMFEDLELPDLSRKRLKEIQAVVQTKRKGYRHKGIPVRLDKRRSVIRKKRRAIQQGLNRMQPLIYRADYDLLSQTEQQHYITVEGNVNLYKLRIPFHENDLKFKHIVVDTKEESNAVVICIMDTSGSMDTMKKYLARCFFFLLYQFVVTKYRSVELVFIAHHTEAREVTEEEFFHKGESGGTFISSGYQKALSVIKDRYDPTLWNVYAFHCSDGDNFDSDNATALVAAKQLVEICNRFGYGEIKPMSDSYYTGGSMLKFFGEHMDPKRFRTILIKQKEDLFPAFKEFLDAKGGDL